MSEHLSAPGSGSAFFDVDGVEAVDLDHVLGSVGEVAADCVSECSCGARRTILRHMAISPCAGRAMAQLKAAHSSEYAGYLAELKAEALAEFEQKWRNHLAGDHGCRAAR